MQIHIKQCTNQDKNITRKTTYKDV